MEARVQQGMSRLAELEEQEQRLRTRQCHLDEQVSPSTALCGALLVGHTPCS
jgi:hypothetical protein